MFRKSNLAVLIALAVGAAGGWAAASGKLDSLLRAEQKATTAPAVSTAPCPESGCCADADKAAILARSTRTTRR